MRRLLKILFLMSALFALSSCIAGPGLPCEAVLISGKRNPNLEFKIYTNGRYAASKLKGMTAKFSVYKKKGDQFDLIEIVPVDDRRINENEMVFTGRMNRIENSLIVLVDVYDGRNQWNKYSYGYPTVWIVTEESDRFILKNIGQVNPDGDGNIDINSAHFLNG